MHQTSSAPAGMAGRYEGLAFWLIVALLLRLLLALALPTLYHPDEVMQSLEPAHRLLYGYGAISWEWRYGIRSWVLPGLLAGVMRATAWMGAGSRGYLFGVNLFLSLLSLSTVWFGWAWARRVSGARAGALAAAGCALYFGLAGLAPKALSEAIACYALLPGLYLGYFVEGRGGRWRLFASGLLCALAVCLRVQLLPSVAFALIYFCWSDWRRRLAPLAAGVLPPVLFFGWIDWLSWGRPWSSFVSYIWMNIGQGRSHNYGTAPWFTYLWVLPVLLIPSCWFWLRGVRRASFLAIFAAIFVLAHSAIAHKEERFLLPVVPLCLTISALGMARERNGAPITGRRALWTGGLCFLVTSILMGAGYYYFDYETGSMQAMRRLSVDPELCGAALYRLPWTESGGYAYLHRNLPVLPVTEPEELERKAPAFNTILAAEQAGALPAGYLRGRCAGGVCIYRRPGGCAQPAEQDTLNGYLKRRDE